MQQQQYFAINFETFRNLLILFCWMVHYSSAVGYWPQINLYPANIVQEGTDLTVECEIQNPSQDEDGGIFAMNLLCPLQDNFQCFEDCKAIPVNPADKEYLKKVSESCIKLKGDTNIVYRYIFPEVNQRLAAETGFQCQYKGNNSPRYAITVVKEALPKYSIKPTTTTKAPTESKQDIVITSPSKERTVKPTKGTTSPSQNFNPLTRLGTSKLPTPAARLTTTSKEFERMVNYDSTSSSFNNSSTTAPLTVIATILNYAKQIPSYILYIILGATAFSIILSLFLCIRFCLIKKYSKNVERKCCLEMFFCMKTETTGLHQMRHQRNVEHSNLQSGNYSRDLQMNYGHPSPEFNHPPVPLQGVSPGRRSGSISRQSDHSGGHSIINAKYDLNRSVPQGLNTVVYIPNPYSNIEAHVCVPESRRQPNYCPPYKRLSQSQPKLNYMDQVNPALFKSTNMIYWGGDNASQPMPYPSHQTTFFQAPPQGSFPPMTNSPVISPHHHQQVLQSSQQPGLDYYTQSSQKLHGKDSIGTGYQDSDSN